MLGTLEDYQKSVWKAHVPTLVHAYNARFHDGIGYSPYFLMFKHYPKLAIDGTEFRLTELYDSDWIREEIKRSAKFCLEEGPGSVSEGSSVYDVKARSSVLRPGDRVLVK